MNFRLVGMFERGKGNKIALKKTDNASMWRLVQFSVPIILALVIYLPILQNNFTFDDFRTVINNQCVNGTLSVKESLSHDFWCMPDTKSNGSWRPLTVLVLRSISSLFGNWPLPYHVLSIFLYLLVVALSMGLTYVITQNHNITAFTGLLFAVHPVHTEAVASITSIADLLSAVFVLWGIMIYAGLLHDSTQWQRRWIAIPLVFIGLLAKESAATGFGILMLIDLAIKLSKPQSNIFFKNKGLSGSKLWVPWALAIITWVIYLTIKKQLLGQLVPAINGEDNLLVNAHGVTYYATAFSALFEYMRLLVFPLKLSIDYSFNQLPLQNSFLSLHILVAMAIMFSSIIAGFLLIGKRFYLGFAILFIWITLSISTNLLVMVPTMLGERLLLLPSFGFCLVLGILVEKIRPPVGNSLRILFIVGTTLIVLLASYKTISRNLEWYNNITIFESAARISPHSKKVQTNMGWFYRLKGNWPKALTHYEKAFNVGGVELDVFLYRELGLCHHALKELDKAISMYNKALEINPTDVISKKLKQQALNNEIPPDLNHVPRDMSGMQQNNN